MFSSVGAFTIPDSKDHGTNMGHMNLAIRDSWEHRRLSVLALLLQCYQLCLLNSSNSNTEKSIFLPKIVIMSEADTSKMQGKTRGTSYHIVQLNVQH